MREWSARHPLGAYVVLTFGISWPCFIAAIVGGGDGLIVLGAFGPAIAAAIVTRWTGASVREWWHGLWRWRVPARFYVFALGFPPLFVAAVASAAALFGATPEFGPIATIVPRHVVTVVLVAALGGGQEEPGWRGFALDRYQAAFAPLRATVLLALVWGAWHLPVYGVGGFGGPVLLIVYYTWLFNRTGSVALCMLLHASFNTSIGYLDLATAGTVMNVTFISTAVVAAAVMIVATRGRLGLGPPISDSVAGGISTLTKSSSAGRLAGGS
jgi:membrane protease YdiL (CAAX protease family)